MRYTAAAGTPADMMGRASLASSHSQQIPLGRYQAGSNGRGIGRIAGDTLPPISAGLADRYGLPYGLQSGPPSLSDGSTDRGMGPEEINTM